MIKAKKKKKKKKKKESHVSHHWHLIKGKKEKENR
jgi:hypothetical protein